MLQPLRWRLLRIPVTRVQNQSMTQQKNLQTGTCIQNIIKYWIKKKDTVEVIVLDPHETDSSMGQDWRERPLLLFVHQKSHEMLNLGHVHIATVISANQNLKGSDGICTECIISSMYDSKKWDYCNWLIVNVLFWSVLLIPIIERTIWLIPLWVKEMKKSFLWGITDLVWQLYYITLCLTSSSCHDWFMRETACIMQNVFHTTYIDNFTRSKTVFFNWRRFGEEILQPDVRKQVYPVKKWMSHNRLSINTGIDKYQYQ